MKSRAPQACVVCRQTKVKCDVVDVGIPCSRCKSSSNEHKCLVVASKRGKYKTPRIHKGELKFIQASPSLSSDGSSYRLPLAAAERDDANGKQASSSQRSLRSDASVERETGNVVSANMTATNEQPNKSWESVLQDLFKPSDSISLSRGSSVSLSFLGESSPLSMLLRHLKDSGHVQIRIDSSRTATIKYGQGDGATIQATNIRGNQDEGKEDVLDTLDKSIVDEFVAAYFAKIHPFYPCINKVTFAEMYENNEASKFLMNAMCFAASYYCSDMTIYRAGFASRTAAKESFYQAAKDIFCNNPNNDMIVNIQGTLLLSFKGGDPNEVWNNRMWLGVAITLAHELGIHRSVERSNMTNVDKSHVRRLWWCLVFRDIMSSITFGRPPKISPEMCDVELITMMDMTFDAKVEEHSNLYGQMTEGQAHYFICVCKLHQLLFDIIGARFNPGSKLSRPQCEEYFDRLTIWRDEIPSDVDWAVGKPNLFKTCLHILYHHLRIYIYRPLMVDSPLDYSGCSPDKALGSASEISVISSGLMMDHSKDVPQDIFVSVFTAMVILAKYAIPNTPNYSMTHATQLQICKMVLNQSMSCWDHTGWVLKLFDYVTSPESQNSSRADAMAAIDVLLATTDTSLAFNNPGEDGFYDIFRTLLDPNNDEN